MQKFYIGLALILIAISTSFAYRLFEIKWVNYRKAETYFHNKNYSEAIEYYIKAVDEGVKPKYGLGGLIDIAKVFGKYDEVSDEYEAMLRKQPDNFELLESLTLFYVRLNRLDKAISLLKDCLFKFPDDGRVNLQLARILSWNHEYLKSIEEYKQILFQKKNRTDLSRFEIKWELARVQAFAGEYVDAIDSYKEMIQKKPSYYEIQIELANIYLMQKEYEDLFEVLKKIPLKQMSYSSQVILADLYVYNHQYDKAEKIYRRYLKKHPRDDNVRLNFAQMLVWSKNPKQSQKILESFRMLYSSNEEAVVDLTKSYQDIKDYPKAIELYKHLVKSTKEEDEDILVELGNIYIHSGDIENAAKNYQKAYLIDENDEIQKKLAFALSWENENEQALDLLWDLFDDDPTESEIGLEIARIYFRENNVAEAKEIIRKLLKEDPNDINVLLEQATFEANLGDAKKSKELFLEILEKTNNSPVALLAFADSMNSWGDFYKAEKIYRKYIKNYPNDSAVIFKLAFLLASIERFEESEEYYKQMIFLGIDLDKAYRDLAKVKIFEKEYFKASEYAEKALRLKDSPENSIVLSHSYYLQKKYHKSIEIYKKLLNEPSYKDEGLTGIGKSYIKLGQIKKANTFFAEALLIKPQDQEIWFYLNFNKVFDPNFIEKILNSNLRAADFEKLASIYNEYEKRDIALKLYERAIEKNSNYFPARFGFAQTLAILNKYNQALEELGKLNEEFPQDYKIMIWKARVLGWSKQYDASIKAYTKLKVINPKDPVIIREMGRVAAWSNDILLADNIYDEALVPSVDQKLKSTILPLAKKINNRALNKDMLMFNKNYQGYETISKNVNKYHLSKTEKKKIQEILLEFFADYEIQKTIYLEKEGKNFIYQQKYIAAKSVFKKLLKEMPYNQEACFDLAQVQCILGLCNESRKSYEKLLYLDPTHNIANIALKNSNIRSNPFLRIYNQHWIEAGRGDIDRIIRNRWDLTIAYPLNCSHWLSFTGYRWNEKPTFARDSQIINKEDLKGISYPAYGYSINYDAILSEYVKTQMSFSQKYYNHTFKTINMGDINFWFNLKDYVHLGVGFEREDELDNYFSLVHNIRISSWWVRVNSDIKRRVEIKSLVNLSDYSDKNFIQQYRVDLGYRLSLYPTILKVGGYFEYRDSKHLNIFKTQGPFVVDIIHPYWTPDKYKSYRVLIEWYHDISKYLFCGSKKNYYDLKMLAGNDTEKNPSFTIEGEWFYEFKDNWMFGIKSMVNRSVIWNAYGVWAEIKYQF